MIADYNVIRSEKPAGFIASVKKALGDGWEPLGGMCFDRDGWYCQTIVRRAVEQVQPPGDPVIAAVEEDCKGWCPKCGDDGAPEIEQGEDVMVVCQKCGTEGPGEDTAEEAVEAWEALRE